MPCQDSFPRLLVHACEELLLCTIMQALLSEHDDNHPHGSELLHPEIYDARQYQKAKSDAESTELASLASFTSMSKTSVWQLHAGRITRCNTTNETLCQQEVQDQMKLLMGCVSSQPAIEVQAFTN